VVPTMGYSERQLADLQATLEAIPCDLILSATPVDLRRVMKLSRPLVQVHYDYQEMHGNPLANKIREFMNGRIGKESSVKP